MNTTLTSKLAVTYAVPAAFGSVDMACPRVAAAPRTRVPQDLLLWLPGTDVAGTSRKRPEGNQHIFMIQRGAMGAGASGPSPWGCPV